MEFRVSFSSQFLLRAYTRVLHRTVSFLLFPSRCRCPGCKELKSAHDFGRPAKNCPGPVRNDTEQDRAAVDELEHTEAVGATASTNPDVL